MKINSVLKPKHAAWASGALVAAILVIVVTHSGPKASLQAPPTPAVKVAAVKQKDVPIYGEWIGTLIGQVNADVKAQVTGYLLTRKYKEGTDWRFWWACVYRWRCLLSWGSAIYFSASSYSMLGGNDVSLPSDWRTLGPLESVIGVLMCGLSVSLLFAIVIRLLSLRDSCAGSTDGHRANAALGGRTPRAA